MKVLAALMAAVMGSKVGEVAGQAMGLLAAGVVLLMCWLAHSWRYPYTVCWWCDGAPKRRDQGGRNWAPCWLCGGSGRRRRVGAVVLGRGFGMM